MTKKLIILTGLAAVASSVLFGGPTNRTMTVRVGWREPWIWQHTNCIDAYPHTMSCWLIRYVESGKTNEFHAFAVGLKIETNAP